MVRLDAPDSQGEIYRLYCWLDKEISHGIGDANLKLRCTIEKVFIEIRLSNITRKPLCKRYT